MGLYLQNQMQQSVLFASVNVLHDTYENMTLEVLLGGASLWPWLNPLVIPVTPVHTILTDTNSLFAPIDGRVQQFNANDSAPILIRETHQIQTTSQVNRQVQGQGTGGHTEGQT